MRYSILNAIVQQVKNVGGGDIKEARSTGIIFATLSEEQADKLRSQGCTVNKVGGVSAVVMPPVVAPPIPVAAIPTYTPEELVLAIGLEELRPIVSPPLYGEGFNVAVIGTGIRETHEKINGRVVYRKNYTSDPMRDGLNHDTGIASIILTVVPLCNILNMKVLNDKGNGTEEDVVLAIDDCISLHNTNPEIAPIVINLSLGSPDDGNLNNPLRVACRAAIEKGIWIAASAGNSGPTPYSITCPACERYVMSVGSIKYLPDESSFIVSNWSSRGPTLEGLIKPDVSIFGEDIIMASSESDTATIAKSGTSFAAPFLSGFGVLYREGEYKQAIATQPIPGITMEVVWGITVQEILDRYLTFICIKPKGIATGKDNEYGYGVPFGPSVIQALRYRPLVDISTIFQPIMGVVMLGILGMIIAPMTKRVE